MNGSYAINEQLSGKFHVTNIDKLPMNNPSEDILSQTTSIPDETGCASRFQMIRVDRNFGRGRWKVNDYEPPENTSISTNPLVNTIENDSNHSIFSNVQSTPNPVTTIINGDSNVTTSTAAAAAPVAVATATAFQQQQQQQQPRMAINNTPTVIPPPTGLIHGYPPGPLPNQSYILSNHHPQFGYYPFYPPPYSHYPSPWAPTATLPPPNPYLQPPTLAQLQQQQQQQQQQTTSQLSSTTNLNDPLRLSDTDNNNENTFSNSTIDPLQNAQLAAYLFSLQHSHPSYIPQTSSTASSYATIPSFHSVLRPYPTILPPQTLPLSKTIPNNTTDIQQSHQTSVITSPTHDEPKILLQQSSLITPKTKPLVPTILNGINNDSTKTTHIDDLMSSSPALINIQPVPPSLISPINISTTNPSTTSLNDYWTYTTTNSPLNLTQTPAVRAGTTMVLLNNETSQKTEITEILKELTTPTKQNNIADIDNKISAAMDLVKMHLLSAVREEVTELRQKIRILNEKMNNLEQENAFLRQHVPNEIYTQYISTINTALSSSNDSTNSTTNPINSISSISSSQPTAMTPLLIIPSTLSQQTTTTLSTNQSQPS